MINAWMLANNSKIKTLLISNAEWKVMNKKRIQSVNFIESIIMLSGTIHSDKKC